MRSHDTQGMRQFFPTFDNGEFVVSLLDQAFYLVMSTIFTS